MTEIMYLNFQEDPGEDRKEEIKRYRNLMMNQGQKEKEGILRQRV